MGLLNSSLRNKMLACLPQQDLDRLAPRLRPVRLARGQILWERNQAVLQVYFPESGIVSAVARAQDGAAVEAAVLGSEGFVGVGAIVGGGAPLHHVVQVAAVAHVMSADDFRLEWGRAGNLQRAVMNHIGFFLSQIAQTALCNRLHPLEARLCRWLLVVADRAETEELPLTQEFLAVMLGARRAGVTLAAGALREQGLIDYRRGRVFLRDRAGLEARSCECHRAIGNEVRRLHDSYSSLR